MKKMLFATVVIACAVGCVSGPERGYVNRDDDVLGRPDHMEYTQKSSAISQMIEQMLTDPMFTTQYDAARKRSLAAGRTLPTIAVRRIENNTGDGLSDSAATGQIYRELMAQLRKTRKFEMIDYVRRKQMLDAVVSAVGAGESPSNLQSIGGYTIADFIMTGELKREMTDEPGVRVYHYFLNMEMTDTSTGTVFWNDTVTVGKFEAK